MYIRKGKAIPRAGTRPRGPARGRWKRVDKLCRICEHDDEQYVNILEPSSFWPPVFSLPQVPTRGIEGEKMA